MPPEAPSLDIDLWRGAFRGCELRHDLFPSCLVARCSGGCVEDCASLVVSGIDGSSHFAGGGMVSIWASCASAESAVLRFVLADTTSHDMHSKSVAGGEDELVVAQGPSSLMTGRFEVGTSLSTIAALYSAVLCIAGAVFRMELLELFPPHALTLG